MLTTNPIQIHSDRYFTPLENSQNCENVEFGLRVVRILSKSNTRANNGAATDEKGSIPFENSMRRGKRIRKINNTPNQSYNSPVLLYLDSPLGREFFSFCLQLDSSSENPSLVCAIVDSVLASCFVSFTIFSASSYVMSACPPRQAKHSLY